MVPLELEPAERRSVLDRVAQALDAYLTQLPGLPVAPSPDPAVARRLLEGVDFAQPLSPDAALDLIVEGLTRHQVHNGHPAYFGLFNPATSTMSIAADALAAGFNPQLAAWTHAPFACEVEQLLLRRLGEKLGLAPGEISGSFTTGGAEANHSALLSALVRAYPAYAADGARSLPGPPVVYVSSESHHSFLKAARLSGLGTSAVREVDVDEDFVMDPAALDQAVVEDRSAGRAPVLVVATLGTTGAGLIDPIGPIADVAKRHGLWLHADAAWGGAAALVPELRSWFAGVERADSLTIDAHKWLSVPMGAGMFLTRHPELLEPTFAVTTGYMPRAQEGADVLEPHRSSMQWTRRFIGLKLFATLLVAGFPGYEETIRAMVRLGDLLRARLEANDWRVVNRTPLPVVCFRDARTPAGGDSVDELAAHVVSSGRAWISVTRVGTAGTALRACISSFRTRESDLDDLLDCLEKARGDLRTSA